MKTFKTTVRGHEIRTATKRRFIAVVVRPTAFEAPEGTYIAFAEVRKRSDNLATLRTFARRYGVSGTGVRVVLIDTATGEEV